MASNYCSISHLFDTNEIEHIFMLTLAIYNIFVNKLFISFAHFPFSCLFLLNCRCSIYYVDIVTYAGNTICQLVVLL